jgi:Fe-S-cluster containining protein
MSHPEPEPAPPGDTANIHLRMLGKDHTFSVPIPLGERTVLDLLPAARELTAQATAVVVDDARAQGREISCRAGCGACCRQLVAISYVEAQDLADLVASMPPERQAVIRARFAEAVRRLEAAGLLGPVEPDGRAMLAPDLGTRESSLQVVARLYFEQQIPCPFLEDESCSIHPRRPLVCREYHVTSPAENCARLYQVGVDRVMPPLHMGDVLARTAHLAVGASEGTIPLVLSLEWSEAHGAQLKQPRDGMEMFRTMIGEIDPDHARPFGGREGEGAGSP